MPFDTIRTRLVGQGEPKVILNFVSFSFLQKLNSNWINVWLLRTCFPQNFIVYDLILKWQVYRGILHALSSMVRQEGILSLYKGLTPNLIQIAPHTGMQFTFFHLFSNLYKSIFQIQTGEGPNLTSISPTNNKLMIINTTKIDCMTFRYIYLFLSNQEKNRILLRHLTYYTLVKFRNTYM